MSRIAICGSMFAMEKIFQLQAELNSIGHTVSIPKQTEEPVCYSALSDSEIASFKNGFIRDYLQEIKNSDAVVIANISKNGIAGYVGPNTLMEMAFAFAFDKRIFLLNSPGEQSCRAEVLGMHPTMMENGSKSVVL